MNSQILSKKNSYHQAGVALLTVLFILVLLSTLIFYMIEDEHILIRRVSNQLDAEQGYQMVIGSEKWAMKILQRDLQETKTDHLNESWNNLLPEVNVEQGTLSARVIDQQGLFNINNLRAGKDNLWYPAFKRLLGALDLEEGLADSIVDWIDPDEQVTGATGAEDPEYLLEDPPYRAANNLIVDVGELLWVKGFDNEILGKLAPYITALPENDTKLNINTSSLLVLQVLNKTEENAQPVPLEASIAATLEEGRGEQGYATIEEFVTLGVLAGLGEAITPLITVNSNYFKVVGTAKTGRISYSLSSLLHRNADSATVSILQRQRSL